MRWFERFVAWAGGYFWLPCPMCGEMFGGHEIANMFTAAVIGEDGHAYCVCPKPQCNHDAAVRNMSNGHPAFVVDKREEKWGCIKITPVYGHDELFSWFEPRGDKLIGMGRMQRYDENGRLVETKIEETGIVVTWR
jgi:hypothetical protein